MFMNICDHFILPFPQDILNLNIHCNMTFSPIIVPNQIKITKTLMARYLYAWTMPVKQDSIVVWLFNKNKNIQHRGFPCDHSPQY